MNEKQLPKSLRLITDYTHIDNTYKEGTIFTRGKDGFYHSKKYAGHNLAGSIFTLTPEIWEASLSDEHLTLLKRIDKKLDKLLSMSG